MTLPTRVLAFVLSCLATLAWGCGDDDATTGDPTGGSGGSGGGGGDEGGGGSGGRDDGGGGSGGSDGGGGAGGGEVACGDGAVEAREVCDDGNTADDDGCATDCTVEAGWVCDDAMPTVCTPECGDGTALGDEECDDGNTEVDDGCSTTCTVEDGWGCDGSMPSVCTEICGDGFVTESEGCDDGDTADLDGCSGTCTVEAGYVCAGEPSTCAPDCGDGAIVGAEECDDANTTGGDGCSDLCVGETGWLCSGEPSTCVPDIGDTCANPYVLSVGNNTVAWTATQQDYITAAPACSPSASYLPDGPDVVMEFTASITGELDFSIVKPASTRWHLVISDSGCGTISPALLCLSEFTNPELAGTFEVTAGTTYYFYVVDSTSGANPLNNPLQVDIIEATETCGDGVLVGNETCDDANAAGGDGCSSLCQVETGYGCTGEPSVCVPAVGDDCSSAFVLAAGPNSVAWSALTNDYLTSAPSCSSTAPTGPDLVLAYTASVTGELDFSIVKPTNTRWHLVVNDDTCGIVAPELLCVSDFANPELGGVFQVTAGTTYYFYLVDTTSGTNPLSDPLQVDILETAEICGDGLMVTGETCDDANLVDGDGCSSVCQIEPGYTCAGEPSTCVLEAGDDCSAPYGLGLGPNTVIWAAGSLDYITSAPTCNTTAPTGPDLVMEFTATVTGALDFSIAKPASTRWHLIVSDAACGTITPALVCVSDFTNPQLAGTIPVTSGNTYYFYLVDTTSGTNPLSNPLLVNLFQESCGDGAIVGAEDCDDANLVDGDGCSSLCQIEPGYVCNSEPSVCFVPPCSPGTNGMVGDTVSLMTTDLPTTLAEGYMAVDGDPNGYVYIGGTSALHRVPKVGGPNENLTIAAGLTTSNLGYTMLIDGLDIYTLEAKSSGTAGHLWRISDSGGTSFGLTDYGPLPLVPNDTLQAVVVDGGTLYAMTNELTTTTDTQVFAWPAGGTPPVPAVLEDTFVGEGRCAGLAMDATYYYTACGTGERLVRVDRATGAVTLLTTAFNLDVNANGVFADDVDADGTADYLYFKGGVKEIGFVCDPGGAAPYAGVLATYGSGSSTSSYGLAFDPVTLTLYAFDDATEEIVIVE